MRKKTKTYSLIRNVRKYQNKINIHSLRNKLLFKYFDSGKSIDIFHVCNNVIKYGYPTEFIK